MNEKPERSRAARLAPVTAVVLAGMVIFLSQQVIALKNERQRLLSDADASTRAFTRGFPPRAELKAGDPIRRFRSNLSNVVNIAKVSGAPSVIVADGRCEITAAGSGLTGSRLVLERVLEQSTSP
jgi:hypothetical protein